MTNNKKYTIEKVETRKIENEVQKYFAGEKETKYMMDGYSIQSIEPSTVEIYID